MPTITQERSRTQTTPSTHPPPRRKRSKLYLVILATVFVCGAIAANAANHPSSTTVSTVAAAAEAPAMTVAAHNANPARQRPPDDTGWGTKPLPDKPFSGFSPVRRDGKLLLTQYEPAQQRNASLIVWIGEQMNLPPKAWIIALATASQECQLYNCANSNYRGYPEVARATQAVPYENASNDNDSCGFFQERVVVRDDGASPEQLMNKEFATRLFYTKLQKVKGWEGMDITVVAQKVQVSSFPTHYAVWEQAATALVDYVRKYEPVM